MLEEIKQTFENIRSAIEERGVQVGECESPTTYPNRIMSIGNGGASKIFFIPVFKSSTTKPFKPTTPIDADNPTNYPDGWSTPDELTGNIWMSYTLVEGSYVHIPWTEPVLISGNNSQNALKTFIIYTKLPSSTVPYTPVGGTWNADTDRLVGNIVSETSSGATATWSTDNVPTAGVVTWMSIGTFGQDGNIIGFWNTPFCIKDGKDAIVDYNRIYNNIDTQLEEAKQTFEEYADRVLTDASDSLTETAEELQNQIEDAEALIARSETYTHYDERISDLEDNYQQVMTNVNSQAQTVTQINRELDTTKGTVEDLVTYTGIGENPSATSVKSVLDAQKGTIVNLAKHLSGDETISAGSSYDAINGSIDTYIEKQSDIDGRIQVVSQRLDTTDGIVSSVIQGYQTSGGEINVIKGTTQVLKADGSETISYDGEGGIAGIMTKVGDDVNEAKLGVSKVVDSEGNIKSASIIAAINDDESSVTINADKLNVNASQINLQNGSTITDGSEVVTVEQALNAINGKFDTVEVTKLETKTEPTSTPGVNTNPQITITDDGILTVFDKNGTARIKIGFSVDPDPTRSETLQNVPVIQLLNASGQIVQELSELGVNQLTPQSITYYVITDLGHLERFNDVRLIYTNESFDLPDIFEVDNYGNIFNDDYSQWVECYRYISAVGRQYQNNAPSGPITYYNAVSDYFAVHQMDENIAEYFESNDNTKICLLNENIVLDNGQLLTDLTPHTYQTKQLLDSDSMLDYALTAGYYHVYGNRKQTVEYEGDEVQVRYLGSSYTLYKILLRRYTGTLSDLDTPGYCFIGDPEPLYFIIVGNHALRCTYDDSTGEATVIVAQ